jgi:DNA mismatch repair protein MutS2
VVVPRFGYDRPGRVVKLDPRKKTAIVAIGQMQWNVAIDELIPQVLRTPEAPEPARAKAVSSRPAPRLEDFGDEPSAP